MRVYIIVRTEWFFSSTNPRRQAHIVDTTAGLLRRPKIEAIDVDKEVGKVKELCVARKTCEHGTLFSGCPVW